MTTLNSRFHPKLLLLLLLVVILTGAAEEQPPMQRPARCVDKCGDIDIPFPFGIGPGCFRDGFEVWCNNSRAFLAVNKTALEGYQFSNGELVSISVATSEARVYAPVAYTCSSNASSALSAVTFATTFAVSLTRNVLVGVGSRAGAAMSYDLYWPSVSCVTNYVVGRTNASCMVEAPSVVGSSAFASWRVTSYPAFNDSGDTNSGCSYAMLVEKSWYNFSMPDMSGDKTLLNKNPGGVPVVLGFTAGYTGARTITMATLTSLTDAKGGYDCPCKSGMKDDGKGGPCTDVFPTAAKAAVGAAGGILLIAIISFIVILLKEKKKMKEFHEKNGGLTLEKAHAIKIFKKGDLKPILKTSNLIGKGCFGEVYKGILDNKLVAIKKPINGTGPESDQFANEVIIQSQVIHKHIVKLIGCCLEVDTPMLVYEFISQGSLHDILHSTNNNKVALNLDARVSIAAQSAEGLAYMHSKANITILDGDVKPANILLDDNFVAKISDFGISRLIARDKEHTGAVIGDMNYMDPVYLQEGLLTEKSDVYSFGIVILELISSRRAIHSENNSLVKSFLEAHKKHERATELFDKEIAVTKDLELLDSLTDMAIECLSLDVDQRPTMMEVAERLLILSRSRKD
ncbi:unnamed protein product [Alopecurus aequalis]